MRIRKFFHTVGAAGALLICLLYWPTTHEVEASQAGLNPLNASGEGRKPINWDARLASVQKREAILKKREKLLEERMKHFEDEYKNLTEEQKKISELQHQADAQSIEINEETERKLENVSAIFGKMKPANAAEFLSAMDPTFAAGIISRMKPDRAAAALSNLDPRSGYIISVLLASGPESAFKNIPIANGKLQSGAEN